MERERMPKDRVIRGDRPPSFPSKTDLAAEFAVSEATIDSWVKRGLLPRPFRKGGAVRWIWADVEASVRAERNSEGDPFMARLGNVS